MTRIYIDIDIDIDIYNWKWNDSNDKRNTVLSKRKLIQLVEQKIVSGWDDPRMPTISGIRRRGIPAEALRLFCERVGISKSDSNIDYTDLENCVREVMDEKSERAFAVLNPLKVTISNWDGKSFIYHDIKFPSQFVI